MKKNLIILIILVQASFAQPIWNGKADTKWYDASQKEFTITKPEQLAGLAKLVNDGNNFTDKTIKLVANIMLNDTAKWQSWADSPPVNKWTPIGKYTNFIKMLLGAKKTLNMFNGTFDGNDFIVSGIYINSKNEGQGLFGFVDSNATIKNLGIAASYIKGGHDVGALAGWSFGNISNSYSKGVITGRSWVGGLVGKLFHTGTISGSYSTCTVTGEEGQSYYIDDGRVGGLVGYNDQGTIIGSYSAGVVKGKNYGLVGENYFGAIILSYYDEKKSGQSYISKGFGKTTEEIQSKEFADTMNFIASFLSSRAWVYEAGKYPILSNQVAQTDMAVFFANGKGTEAFPYIINTQKQLEDFSRLVSLGARFSNKYFKLGQNIMLNDTTNWRDWAKKPPANAWTPIGMHYFDKEKYSSFNGIFDGGGFAVSGVYIKSADNKVQGLFGYVDSDGVIKKLGISASYINGEHRIGGLAGQNHGNIDSSYSENCIITGETQVGGLAGYNYGTISKSYSTGTVTGGYSVGGVAGESEGAINSNYFAGKVEGRQDIGGLAGRNGLNGNINNSYSTGNVKGGQYAGGLVGMNSGAISSSYSIGIVMSIYSSLGEFVGYNGTKGTISNSYYNCDAIGQCEGIGVNDSENKNKIKIEGKTTAEMKQKSTYEGWNFDKVWGIDSTANGGYPYLRSMLRKTE